MTKINEIYKCNVCGNIVQILHAGVGDLVCCEQEMELLKEKTQDASTEKHVPYIEKTEKGILVKVGQNQNHPMEEKHYIEWIEIQINKKKFKKFLNSGDKPEMQLCAQVGEIKARAYCNIHGLWKSK
jgi:superoxide reductase